MAKKKKTEVENVESGSTGADSGSVDGLAGTTSEDRTGFSVADDGKGSAVSGDRSSGGSTITIRIDESGRIDTSAMRDKTTARLRQALQATPEVMPGFGETPALSGHDVPDFMVTAVFQLLGGIKVWAYSQKYPADIAQYAAYGPLDIAVVSDPAKAVLAKYLPKLGRFQEETALVMALASVEMGKIRAMNAMLAERQERRPDVTTIKPASEATQ